MKMPDREAAMAIALIGAFGFFLPLAYGATLLESTLTGLLFAALAALGYWPRGFWWLLFLGLPTLVFGFNGLLAVGIIYSVVSILHARQTREADKQQPFSTDVARAPRSRNYGGDCR